MFGGILFNGEIIYVYISANSGKNEELYLLKASVKGSEPVNLRGRILSREVGLAFLVPFVLETIMNPQNYLG